jgi:signal transduction histidine kinase
VRSPLRPDRALPALPWVLFGFCVTFAAAAAALTYLNLARVPGYQPIEEIGGVIAVTFGAVGALIVSRKPRNSIGRMFLGWGLIGGIQALATNYFVYGHFEEPGLPLLTPAAWLSNWLIHLLVPGFYVVFLLFPSGNLPSRRWTPVLGAAILATAALTLMGLLAPEIHPAVVDESLIDNPTGIEGLPVSGALNWGPAIPVRLAVLILCLAAIPFRFRTARGEERQQIKYLAYVALLMIMGFGAGLLTALAGVGSAHIVAPLTALVALAVGVPIACGLAILRYRLFDIDVVIRRTLVYGALAAFITGVYAAVVVGVGELIGTAGEPNVGLSILATAIVAFAFQPARERLQRLANRLVYGRRATPYEVLSEFSGQLADVYANEEVLLRMARILAEGTVADRVDVWLRVGSELRIGASWPETASARQALRLNGSELPPLPGATAAVPVRHRGELLGALAVSKRVGEPLTPVEEKLVEDLALQAGLVLKNVGLTAELLARLEELRSSRQRLVTAQDAERRRLERNLHDGAQQHLVALRIKASLAQKLATRDPEKLKEVAGQLTSDAEEALETLRELAQGLYPPILADSGLEVALRAQAERAPVTAVVKGEGIRRYTSELEGAVYFCCLEALQNVSKYARAEHVDLRLWEDDGILAFEVSDDGIGFEPETAARGTGLQNMSDRIEALGGSIELRSVPGEGTLVAGRIPATPADAPSAHDSIPAASPPSA